jgi:hypothetical protein
VQAIRKAYREQLEKSVGQRMVRMGNINHLPDWDLGIDHLVPVAEAQANRIAGSPGLELDIACNVQRPVQYHPTPLGFLCVCAGSSLRFATRMPTIGLGLSLAGLTQTLEKRSGFSSREMGWPGMAPGNAPF